MNHDRNEEHNAGESDSPRFHPCFHPVEREDNARLFIWISVGAFFLFAVTIGFMLIF